MTQRRTSGPAIVHVVRSDTFAGVERYICGVVNELSTRGYRARVVGGDGARMTSELERGVRHTNAASTADTILALARQGHADIVHAHMTAAEFAAVCTRPFHRGAVVATRHFPSRRVRALPSPVGALLGRFIRGQVATSRFVADAIREPVVVIHNGVGIRPAATLEARQVLMLQRLSPEKAPDVGLRAWVVSGLWREGWRLLIAGSGAMTAELRTRAASLDVAESVIFLGAVDATEELVRNSSILLAPGPSDSFGLSVVEAMAQGVPVVAAGGGGHLETLGGDGSLFPPGDAEAAAAQLVALAIDADLRREMGARLRARQQRLFSMSGHVDQLEEFYARFLG